jgi:predicted aldo/keto reductase-like oxidoreductase
MMKTTLPFGRTGHKSTRIIFGAYALSQARQAEADAIDTAAVYGDAEERIGPWMENYRDDFFLATKSRSRSYEGAWKDLQRSLRRLRVDKVDLWQMHGLTNPVSWEKVMGPGGALEAFVKARDEGLVRYLGITGHGDKVPTMHVQSLSRFDFDSVLLPYNYMQMQKPRYATNFNKLLEICKNRNIAIQTIKSIVRCPWGTKSQTHNTYFYKPLVNQDAIDKAVHWSMGLPGSFVITAGDMRLLPKILDAATRFEKQPSDNEMESMIDKYDMKPIRCSNVDFR